MRCRYPRDGAQHLLFELGAHARQLAQLLLLAEALQFVDGADVEVLEDQRDALGAEALDLEELERAGREFLPAAGRAARRSRVRRFRPAPAASPLPMPGMSVTLRSGSRRISAMRSGIAFHGGRAVAIAANAEAVLAGDLHQIGGFPEHARDFLVLQTGSSIQLYRVGLDLLALRRVVSICMPAAAYFP